MLVKKNTMEVNGVHQLFGYQHSSKYHKKEIKEIHTDLERHEGE